jgi:hypothetical protein
LPLVPASLEVDPLLLALLHVAAFLDVSEDDSVHPVAAGIALERVGAYVQRLDDDTIDALAEDLDTLIEHAEAANWPTAALEFLASFLENCGFAAETDGEADAALDADDAEADTADADDAEADDADDAEADELEAGEATAGDHGSGEGSRKEPVR